MDGTSDQESPMDTATSEKIVGEAARHWGRPILIATKVPPANRIWPAQPYARFNDVFPKQYVLKCTENSLRNLGIERIDLQQFHVWNASWTTQDEWKQTVENLKQSGKVRYFGISLTEHDPDSGIELAVSEVVDCLQVIYNIFDPAAADRLFPAARKYGVGILARVPFDEGSLAGTISEGTEFDQGDFRAFYFRGDRRRQVSERVGALQQDIPEFSRRLPELAIRFCLSHPAVTSVIPGMRRAGHVETNVYAAIKGVLSDEVSSALRQHRWDRNFYQ